MMLSAYLDGESHWIRSEDAALHSVKLPGIPESGPIGLQQHGEPLEFANLFIRELP